VSNRAAAFRVGRVAHRALVPIEDVAHLSPRAVSVWMAPRAHVVAYPVRQASFMNLVVITTDAALEDGWSGEIAPEVMAARTALFCAPVRTAVAAASHWRQWPLVLSPTLSNYAHGRLALIGDAAHAMVPFLAQGAVMALEDAVVIAEAIAAEGVGSNALQSYSDARLKRTQRVVAAATRNGRIYHLSGPAAVLRNFALQQVSGAALMRRYDWLYRPVVTGANHP
jgi:salicylate hydroxylase